MTYQWAYQRGATPTAVPNVVCVGAIDYTQGGTTGSLPQYVTNNATAKAGFSTCGPRVDVYAPGGFIAGAAANASVNGYYPVVPYPANSNYKSIKESGTSQASPQVAGVLACVLGMRPWMTQQNVQNWIINYSVPKVANAATTGGYADSYNLQNSTNRYLYFPYQYIVNANISGGGMQMTGFF
jgi:subtilisin family serine protease